MKPKTLARARGQHENMRSVVWGLRGSVVVGPWVAFTRGGDLCFDAVFVVVSCAMFLKLASLISRLTIRTFCAHCGKYIPSNVCWVCGYCGERTESHWHSFLHKCPKCKRCPPGFKCPHAGCEQGIFTDNDDASRAHWAYKSGDRPPKLAAPAPGNFEQELERMNQDIQLTKLRRELALAQKEYDQVQNPPKQEEGDPVAEVLQVIQKATQKEEAVLGYLQECKLRWAQEGRPKEDIERLSVRLKAVTTHVLATVRR